ncbi:molybdate ABC transporter permease subunit [Acinetobacter ursingii]|uniref:molybdate ABC transporter permease subunit n=1 Tax=Acinetobacter ursingii TaxID=108980 RepID=UPI0012507FDC|nr:molybdate ABC transporter permease subunit [Acinetobacter ursingii]MCH2016878.1 molybdate ABC transporter permease subunit [Acinetobacter ursingii]MCU4589680.1 molybdate ABC transporter permease subunit [Acinetobacter ursingii]
MFFSLSAEELEVLKLSCQVAAFSLLVNLIPALFVSWLLARKEFWGKSLFETLVFLPLVLPPVVPGYLLLQVFGNNGILGQYLNAWGLSLAFNWKGAVFAAAVMGFPLFVQSIRLAIELVDQRLEMAAKTLGASGLGTFFSITLPLASSGILVGAILCFCRSLGEFGATITFVGNIAGETRTLPLAMYSLMQQPDTEHQVWRLIILSLSVAFFTLWFAQWFHRYQKNKRG